MDVESLRAFARHVSHLNDRLLSEREGHLVKVEQAFRRRHNEQSETILRLTKALAKNPERQAS